MQKTVEMKSPLLSKYCWRENDCQLRAATSFKYSEKYVRETVYEEYYTIYHNLRSFINYVASEIALFGDWCGFVSETRSALKVHEPRLIQSARVPSSQSE